MLFSSVSFLFVFLPLLSAIIFLSPKKLHNLELLLASIIFYAFGEPRFLPIIFAVILISYSGALLMTSFPKYRKVFLFLTITADLGFLFYFKYFNFFADIINNLTGSHFALIEIFLPLGISFYTFQAISYVIDVYRQDVSAQKSLYKFALYICLFPQLIAGPIVKYHDIAESLEKYIFRHKAFYHRTGKKNVVGKHFRSCCRFGIFAKSECRIRRHILAWRRCLYFADFLRFFRIFGYGNRLRYDIRFSL